jgi:hypothetical protein
VCFGSGRTVRIEYLHGIACGLRRQAERAMNAVVAWIRNADNWNAILHNVIANAVVAIVAALGFMVWTYLSGLPLPFVVIAGIAAPGAMLFTLRQLAWAFGHTDSRAVTGEMTALKVKLDTAEGELQVAREKLATGDKKEQRERQRQAEEARINSRKTARLADTKSAIREQLDAAPKVFDLDEINAWINGTNSLLRKLYLSPLPDTVNRHFQGEDNRRRFQNNLAHMRSLLVNLTEDDMHHV